MTPLNLNNNYSSFKVCFSRMKEIFCFSLSLLIKHVEWILKLQTQHRKSLQTCNFHNIEKTSQDILMLAKLHFMLLFFLIIIQPWAALKPSWLEFSFSFGVNFFCWIFNIIQIFMSNLCCCAFFIRFVLTLLCSFEKNNNFYDKGFWLFSAITKVFRSHGSLKMNQKWRLHYNKRS